MIKNLSKHKLKPNIKNTYVNLTIQVKIVNSVSTLLNSLLYLYLQYFNNFGLKLVYFMFNCLVPQYFRGRYFA